MKRWTELGPVFQLVEYKTELFIRNPRRHQPVTIRVGKHDITSKRKLKNLGALIDDRMNFNESVSLISHKALGASVALSRVMPNVPGSRQIKRHLSPMPDRTQPIHGLEACK